MSDALRMFEDNLKRVNPKTEPVKYNEANGMYLFVKNMEDEMRALRNENEEIKKMLRYLIERK